MGLRNYYRDRLTRLRRSVADLEALPQMAFLGLVTGLLTGLVAIFFRICTETILKRLLDQNPEAFEILAPAMRLTLPMGGMFLLGMMLMKLDRDAIRTGIGHVAERFANHQARMPIPNTMVQFLGGLAALVCGMSAGREGPTVHLGASAASMLNTWLRLPHNSGRALVGCGVAAAIAAAYNTPLAGIIFAMEVIMLEFTMIGFLPIMLSSVTAAMMSHLVFGQHPAFMMPTMMEVQPEDLLFILLIGLLAGTISACSIRLTVFFNSIQPDNLAFRFGAAGLGTGLIAWFLPDIMGVGYDSLEDALFVRLPLVAVCLLLAGKLVASAMCVGMGVPGGLIAPHMFMGAMIGALVELVGLQAGVLEHSNALYVVIGMGATLGAVLQAPLTAVLTLMEMTLQADIVLPSLAAVIIAQIVCRQVFGQPSLFVATLRASGITIKHNPIRQTLERLGVTSQMKRDFILLPETSAHVQLSRFMTQLPEWIVITRNDDSSVTGIVPGNALRTLIENMLNEMDCNLSRCSLLPINLRQLPGMMTNITGIHWQFTLNMAHERLRHQKAEAAYVFREGRLQEMEVRGIITKDDILKHISMDQ
jgi:CIC family chloride channel protein